MKKYVYYVIAVLSLVAFVTVFNYGCEGGGGGSSGSSGGPVPFAPSNLSASMFSQNPSLVTLRWTDNSNTEAYFSIESKNGESGTYAEIGTVSQNVTRFDFDAPPIGVTYYYRVRARNSYGYSSYSNEVSYTRPY